MKKRVFLWVLPLFIFAFSSNAQLGYEWINTSQPYYQIKIGEDGVYKLNAQILLNASIPSNINPKNFQLFKNGQEIPIYVFGEEDNSFDAGDYIEFFGEKNRGELDAALYTSPSDQTHSHYSLYTDTAIYFLTWNNQTNNKRITTFQNNDFNGKTADDYFLHESWYTNNSTFYGGAPNNNDGLQSFSEYTSGEGFLWYIWSSQPQININLPAIHTGGPAANVEVLAYSGNHNKDIIVNNANHEFGISLNTKANVIASQRTLGHQRIFINKNVSTSDLSPTTKFWLGEITFAGSAHYVSYFKVRYPRNLDMANTSKLMVNHAFISPYVNLKNFNKSLPIVYDLKNNQRIVGSLSGTNLQFNLQNAGQGTKFYITDATEIIEIGSTNIQITNITNPLPTTTADYLIVTHKNLQSGAQKYKNYRESSDGGSYKVAIANVSDIYLFYNFGIEHPIAIKKYLAHVKSSVPSMKHILLLGKGQTYNRIRTNTPLRLAYNLVPSIGIPASDMLYMSPMNASSLKVDFSLGRVPARDNNQIDVYLDKLRQYESAPAAEWKKKVIQLAGGADASENNQYQSYLKNYLSVISDTSLGGYRVLFSKTDPVPVQTSLTGAIQQELNKGAGMLSYFGHGAAQVTEISLGEPSQLNNYGKTPLFLFNGCALGNTYEDLSLGEQFLFEPQKGALGWIASTNFGFSSTLYAHSLAFHKALFQTHYGQGIGAAMKASLDNFGNPNNPFDRMEARHLVYHGDPALTVYSPSLPDYITKNVSVNTNSGFIDSVSVSIDLSNIGKATRQTLKVDLEVTNSSGTDLYAVQRSVPAPLHQSSLQIRVPNHKLSGLTNFKVTLDVNNTIPELGPNGENNNEFNYTYLFQSAAPLILYPAYDAIVPVYDPELVFQINQYIPGNKIYSIEWDTTPYFAAPIGSASEETEAHIVRKTINLPNKNNQDYYVRIRYAANGKTSDWTVTTFGVIENEPPGWTEGNKWKYYNTGKDNMALDSTSGRFEFERTNSKDYQIQTNGFDKGRFAHRRIIINGEPPIWNWWPANGINIMAINPDTDQRIFEENNPFNSSYLTPWGPPNGSNSPYDIVGRPTGVYNYNTNLDNHQDSLIGFLNRLPKGYHIIMLNGYDYDVGTFKSELWIALEAFGIQHIKVLSKGNPFAVYGTKGGTAVEFLPDFGNTVTPPNAQTFVVNHSFSPRLKMGKIISKSVGSATSWKRLKIDFKDLNPNEDSFIIVVRASSDKINWNQLLTRSNDSILDLSAIDATIYPYLQFNVHFFDKISRTPPTIRRWRVNYTYPSEVSVNLDGDLIVDSDTVEQGNSIKLQIPFRNLLAAEYDSSTYLIYTRSSANTQDTVVNRKTSAIPPLGNILFKDTIETLLMSGDYDLFLQLNPNKNIKESFYDNNVLLRKIHVKTDDRNPLLDVVFDGVHILDNDIVSPNTLITITAQDDNAYLFINEAQNFKATLLKPDGTIDSLIQFTNQWRFVPATKAGEKAVFEFQAKDLQSGIHTLEAQAYDATGNPTNKKPYRINFKVVRESSISNIYPYPNPFTSAMKFVFTLTGAEIPDYMKIQISTITGKVVRELTHADLGPIRIGNNISEFTWDGTDEYGDILANGVYLYTVTAKLNGKEISKFSGEDGNTFFKNGIGKIYLMR